MNTEDVTLKNSAPQGACAEGHFVLSSGRTGTLPQKNLVFQYPERAAPALSTGKALAA